MQLFGFFMAILPIKLHAKLQMIKLVGLNLVLVFIVTT